MRLILAAAALSVAMPAVACSVAPGYRVPTTLELAEQAEVIVLARVEGGTSVGRDEDGKVTLASLLLLKGDTLPERFEMPGWLATSRVRATRSDPDELARVNPDALTGGCNRYIFARGMMLVLFLTREGGVLRPLDMPFARTAEDVPSFDARWVKAVREYVAIAALPRESRKERLVARRDALSRSTDGDSRAIAADMTRQLSGPNKPLREPFPPVPDGLPQE